MSFERDITGFLHARASAWVLWLGAAAAAVAAWSRGLALPAADGLGLGLPSPGTWLGDSWVSLAVSLAAVLAAGVMVITINRVFNILRSLTALAAGMFFAMEAGYPQGMAAFYGGTLMAVTMATGVFILFSTFARPDRTRRIFLLFFLLALAGMTQAAFLLYIPVFAVGCVQMRIFNARTVTAALLGIVTPPWILLGFGIITPADITLPRMVMAWDLIDPGELVQAIVITATTLLTGVAFISMNLLKILSYNSQVRAYNGFLTSAWIFTAIFTVVNFNDFAFYLPVLFMLTAYQVAHFFTYRRSMRSYLPILMLIAVYAGFCVWSFF